MMVSKGNHPQMAFILLLLNFYLPPEGGVGPGTRTRGTKPVSDRTVAVYEWDMKGMSIFW